MSSSLGFVMGIQALAVENRNSEVLSRYICGTGFKKDAINHMFEKLKHCSSIGFQWIIGVHDSDAWAIEDQVLQRKTQKKSGLFEENVSTPQPQGSPTVF